MVVRPLEASFPNPTSVTTVAVASTMTTLNITHVKGGSALRVSERMDFVTATIESVNHPQPTESCRFCHRKFYGNDCYTYHLMCSQQKKSVCDTVKKCPECCKQVRTRSRKVKRGGDIKSNSFSHKCGMDKCSNCKQLVEVALHQCYIQPVKPEDDEPKKKKKTKKK